jgi:predicted RNA-binding Zn-ribbon protein involved in translation (DUF1610 family)
MKGNWSEYGSCKHCNEIIAESMFCSEFFVPVCPNCGNENSIIFVIAREVYKGVWYNPLTWFSSEWEIRKVERE